MDNFTTIIGVLIAYFVIGIVAAAVTAYLDKGFTLSDTEIGTIVFMWPIYAVMLTWKVIGTAILWFARNLR